MYRYRKLSKEEQNELIKYRRQSEYPLHEPPRSLGQSNFIITAATYEHRNIFLNESNLEGFYARTLESLLRLDFQPIAWVFLPNHYHILLPIKDMKKLSECIRKLHSMSSAFMNRLDHTLGRKVWYSFSDRKMRNEWHMQASIHYIHYNPVKHGWITDPQQWPWSSIHKFIELLGTEKLNSEAQRYDLSLYGRSWDD